MDPLYLLRDHALHKKAVSAEGDQIVFQNARYPKNTPTIFQNRVTKEFYTLDTLVFAFQHADSAHSTYMAACTKAGQKVVTFADNKDLKAFLKGEIDSSPSLVPSAAPTPAPTVVAGVAGVPGGVAPGVGGNEVEGEGEERHSKKLKTSASENLLDIELDEKLLEEKKLNAERLEAGKAVTALPLPDDENSATLEGISKDTLELLKLKRMKRKMATITVDDSIKKPVQKGGLFVQADAVVTKKIIDREKQLSTRATVLNTNGKKNFSDIIQAVTKSAKKEEAEKTAKARDKQQKANLQTYDRYNVKEDQNWWKDKLKTNLEDFEIDTRGTFADGGALGLDGPASTSTSASSTATSSSTSQPKATPSSTGPSPTPSARPQSNPQTRPSSSSSKTSSNSKSSSHNPSKSLSLSTFSPLSPPIIIVPSALTSLITIYNAQEFLQDGKYVNAMTKKSTTPSKPSSAKITHTPKTRGLPDSFIVIDNTTRMAPKDWSRVVAVFVLGQAWQFKDWQWSSPVELFANVRGFYLRCDDTQAPPEVKSWNVKILTISKSKRHLDQTAALEFWNTLEDFLARKGAKF